MLNTLLAPYRTPARIERSEFPLPLKDDVRPFTEDFAMRDLLWADDYFPEKWFSNEKIDDEEKYLEVASMTDDRKERILWLACRIASLGTWIYYDGPNRKFSLSPPDVPSPTRCSLTFGSMTTVGRSDTLTSCIGQQEYNCRVSYDRGKRFRIVYPIDLPVSFGY